MNYSSERNYGCRILEYCHRNLRMISMENEILKISVLLDKGADIYEIIHKSTDTDFMWKAPGGIRDPLKYIPSNANPDGSFLDYYEGGWQEVLPGGGPMQYMGASFGLHGEVCLLPWDFQVIQDAPDEVVVQFRCNAYRIPFKVVKTIGLKSHSGVICFEEQIINMGMDSLEFMWGHHPAVGMPFLNENCEISVPAEKYFAKGQEFCKGSRLAPNSEGTWPYTKDVDGKSIDLSKVPKKDAKTGDLFFLSELKEGWFAVTDPLKKLGYGMRWDLNVFPFVWYWLVAGGISGYPWYSSTYNIALEIWSGMPSTFEEAKAKGALLKISGGETISTKYYFVIYSGIEKVTKIEYDGTVV